MKKTLCGYVVLIGALSLISLSIYGIHYLIFGNIEQTISGLILSLAYVPIGMLYEIVLLDKILERNKKLSSSKRMNLVIGSFYHEVGNDIIKLISNGDLLLLNNKCYNNIKSRCEDTNFHSLVYELYNYNCSLDINSINLHEIYNILENNDTFILNLLTNPSVDIYDEFVEMLMSLLHLRDELELKYSKNNNSNAPNVYHVENDLCKTYLSLLQQWIKYIEELKEFYPVLFVKVLENSVFTKE